MSGGTVGRSKEDLPSCFATEHKDLRSIERAENFVAVVRNRQLVAVGLVENVSTDGIVMTLM